MGKIEFWKERIANARKEHHSVYVTSESDWDYIGQVHKEILGNVVSGRVLDAGCGYGRMCEWVKDYTGVDFSPDFIEIAKKKYPSKVFIQADLKELPFKDNEFDWVVCISIKNMIIGNQGGEVWDVIEKELKRVSRRVLLLEYTQPFKYTIL